MSRDDVSNLKSVRQTQQAPVRERPILFSGPMVRAILDGRKTQTRRVAKLQTEATASARRDGVPYLRDGMESVSEFCRYGAPGDLLWVRETWMRFERVDTMVSVAGGSERPTGDYLPAGYGYRADLDNCGQVPVSDGKVTVLRTPKDDWRPSIFMPRPACRLKLIVNNVRVERVQEITQPEAIREGVRASDAAVVFKGGKMVEEMNNTPRGAFACLWDSINAKRGFGWDANPWVWVVSFERVS